MRNLMNTGTIYARCRYDNAIRTIKFRFEPEQVLFEIARKKLWIKSDGINLYCQLNNTKKTTSFCENYVEAISLLVEMEEKEPLQAQIIIKDIPFYMSFHTSGFVFRCDLGAVEQSYIIFINNRHVFVAQENRGDKKKEINVESMEPCEDFIQALRFIYNSTYIMLKEIMKPERLH